MIHSINGVKGDSNRITSHKSIQFTYTSEKKLINNKEDKYTNNTDKFRANVRDENSRRIDQGLCSNALEDKELIDINNFENDDEILKYIDRIILILSNEPKYSDNNKFKTNTFSKNKRENTTLNTLLSLRLGQINKIKDLYISKEIEYDKNKLKPGRTETCVQKYYPKNPVLNLSEARNDSSLLNSCLKSLRWKSCNYSAGDIFWFGFSISFNQMCDMISRNKCVNYSRIMINKYPDMSEITKKSYFYHILNTYSLYLGGDRWFPKSFRLPEDLKRVLNSLDKRVPLIFKPSTGSMGQGVKVVTVPYDISDELLVDYTAQEYISSPLLLSGKKFDIRVYLLLIGESKAYIYKNSLVRVCTEEYEYPSESNSKNSFIHLTNYSINKSNTLSYHRGDLDDERNNKQVLPSVLSNLDDMGYKKEEIWKQIVNICSLVCGTITPEIHLNSRLCTSKSKKLRKMPSYFQILGLDVIIDTYGKAWLLEINSCPSLKTSYFDGKSFKEDSVDLRVKVPLVTGALKLVHQYENQQKTIHPVSNSSKDTRDYTRNTITTTKDTNIENRAKHDSGLLDKKVNGIDDSDDDWEEVAISRSSKLDNLMNLFKTAKGNRWETNTLSKREWMSFCTSSGIIQLANLIMTIKTIYTGTINTPNNSVENTNSHNCAETVEKDEIYVSGKTLISQMFSESVGRQAKEGEHRICFSYFVYILSQISKLVEKWVKKTNKDMVYDICKKYNMKIKLDELDWKINQPHNSTEKPKIEVKEDFLNFLSNNFNLKH